MDIGRPYQPALFVGICGEFFVFGHHLATLRDLAQLVNGVTGATRALSRIKLRDDAFGKKVERCTASLEKS